MRCAKYHMELNENGEGKCSVPMWCQGVPAGFCDCPAYGKPTKEGRKRFNGYVPGLACRFHGGPTKMEAISNEAEVIRSK